jgi:hypothetical protein
MLCKSAEIFAAYTKEKRTQINGYAFILNLGLFCDFILLIT